MDAPSEYLKLIVRICIYSSSVRSCKHGFHPKTGGFEGAEHLVPQLPQGIG
jgi:hypothetical protein